MGTGPIQCPLDCFDYVPPALDTTADCLYNDAMKKVTIRIPDELHTEIAKAAKRNRRSLNSEILHAIESYLGARSKTKD